MKKFIIVNSVVIIFLCIACNTIKLEDKTKRPSPPAVATATLASRASVKIEYGQPSLNSRVVGLSIEPMNNKIWRAGANEATTFEISKNVRVNGNALPLGKYAFFIWQKDSIATLIFNKEWDTWGAFDYEKNKSKDILTINVPVLKDSVSTEKLLFQIDNMGLTTLNWGTWKIAFTIQ